MRDKVPPVDRRVAWVAARQHGVVTVGQLLDAGLSRGGVSRRAQRGSLHRIHRGVYRVGHIAPSLEATYLAAALACGDTAAVSGHAAAHLLVLTRGASPPPEITTTQDRRVPGVLCHCVRRLDRRDRMLYGPIPVTTVPRTLVDLAATLSPEVLARACHEAQVRYRVSAAHVEAALARKPQARGAEKLHDIFGGRTAVTLSKLEREFLALLRCAGLPLPETNRLVDGSYADCRWPEHGLTVELDGYRYHHTRHAWEQDRRREREARARGDEFRRYTYGDVTEEPHEVSSELARLLQIDR